MVNKPNVQNMPPDLRKKLFTSSDQQPVTADLRAVEESLIRHELQRLNVRTLAGVAGQAVSHTDVVAKTLFRLGMQHGD